MSCPDPLWGKYRGKVMQNEDPLERGRLQIEVPQVPGTEMNWAMPCVPYAGPEVGFCFTPPIGANVWVEFEGGDPSFPIWTGCFWSEGEAPLPYVADPMMHVLKTDCNLLMLDDTLDEGGVSIVSNPPAVTDVLLIKFSSEGIIISAPPGTINMSIEEGITIGFLPGLISLSEEELTIDLAESSVVLTEASASATAPLIALGSEGAITLDADGAIALEAGADVTIQAIGDANVQSASMSVTVGFTQWSGDLNVSGGFQVEGDTALLGPAFIVGEHNVVGATQFEGEVNIAGATTIEGGLLVLGAILQNGMPVMVIPFA